MITVGDLIAALSEYPMETQLIASHGDSITDVISIIGGYPEYKNGKLVKVDTVLLSTWPQYDENDQFAGRVESCKFNTKGAETHRS